MNTSRLDLTVGARLVSQGTEWTVESWRPWCGRVVLRRVEDAGSEPWETTVHDLLRDGDVRQTRTTDAARSEPFSGLQAPVLEDLTPLQRRQLSLRVAHLREVETGYRSGNPLCAAPGEPRPAYDPATTTLTQRRRAKVDELAQLGRQEAELLGLRKVSERTLRRWASGYRRLGEWGCVDGRSLRCGGGHRSVSDEVREAIHAVHRDCLHRAKVSMKTKHRLVHQYVRETFGPDVAVPSYQTLRAVWAEWFGSGGARQRYARTAGTNTRTTEHVAVVHRPGQVVTLDTTVLPVKVRETVFGEAVSVHLTWGLDVYTHSLAAFRLTLVSDTSVDVAMLLRDMMTPLPLRDCWSEELEWAYPGIPASAVADLAGYRVAALPFFTPETVTIDHGSVYKNHDLVEAERVLGVNILPARVLRPVDKQSVERAFGAARSLLFEHLLGYQGVDVADRGADPEADAVLTIEAMEQLIATWIVRVWQNRQLGEYAPSWDPDGRHSPNTLFTASLAQGGFALQVPPPELYYQLLPAHHVKIHGQRGVKIRGLWYDGPGLDAYRVGSSTRGGVHKGKWVVRRDPRDRRFVYFQDPTDPRTWHTLRWVGLPQAGEVPSFGDARVTDLLAAARDVGLTPRSDAELLPVLLELLGGHVPVESWPTQLSKTQRTEQARETLRGEAAAADRPAPAASPNHDPQAPAAKNTAEQIPAAATEPAGATVVPLRGNSRARTIREAVDDERRRRREKAVADQPPKPPPRLGEALRQRSLLVAVTHGAESADPPGEQS